MRALCSKSLSRLSAIFIILVVMLQTRPIELSAGSDAVVSTVAGNGASGNLDGVGADAEFMKPVAVAVGPQGSIYIADFAGQRVRMIDAAGNVSTLAGGGDPLPSGLSVSGGYVDGPTNNARFDGPSGIAVDKDGVAYVADSFNRCIRAIGSGFVTTLAGDPNRSAPTDGPIATAAFADPRSVAVAADGAIYVSDFSFGIRVIRNGFITTLPIPDPYAKAVTSIAILDGSPGFLFGTVRPGVWRFDLKSQTFAILTTSKRLPAAFAPSSVVPVDRSSIVAASIQFDALYFGTYPGFQGEKDSRSLQIAGDQEKDLNFVGGFQDGEPLAAKFYGPMGLARAKNGDIIIADSGNRRIRRIAAGVIAGANP